MSVTSAKYVADTKDGGNMCVIAVINEEELIVPINDEGNRHWVAIQEWVAEGNTIEEAD